MRATPVDPRDVTWEISDPIYRVEFWDGIVSDEWNVSEASNVAEVLHWAGKASAGRPFTLQVLVPDQGNGMGALQLLDLEASKSWSPEATG